MISNLNFITLFSIAFGFWTFLASIYFLICWSMADDSKQKEKEYKNGRFYKFWVSLVFSVISFLLAIISYYYRE